MKIVADQNIPLLDAFYADIGEVKKLSGREITRDDLIDCDVLIVRSVTKVNEALLSGTPVKFVGTCTIGLDHIDLTYLEEQGIQWANAPGCNANAVVQYVFSTMAALMPNWQEKTVGIIGCGSIGTRLHSRFTQLGVKVSCYDPFSTDDEQADLVTFDEVLKSDIITCHTPLTKTGPFPSFHLLDKTALEKIPKSALIINSCRGGVIDETALLDLLPEKQFKLAIDVWENEPQLNFTLLDQVDIATPHIAGYTLEGRENGTAMVYEALIDFLAIDAKPIAEIVSNDVVDFENEKNKEETLNTILLQCYPINEDDQRLREGKTAENFGQYFDRLRKNYPHRREYTHYDFSNSVADLALKKQLDIISLG